MSQQPLVHLASMPDSLQRTMLLFSCVNLAIQPSDYKGGSPVAQYPHDRLQWPSACHHCKVKMCNVRLQMTVEFHAGWLQHCSGQIMEWQSCWQHFLWQDRKPLRPSTTMLLSSNYIADSLKMPIAGWGATKSLQARQAVIGGVLPDAHARRDACEDGRWIELAAAVCLWSATASSHLPDPGPAWSADIYLGLDSSIPKKENGDMKVITAGHPEA